MALFLGASTSDKIVHGNDASLDDLPAFTVLMLVYPTTSTATRHLFGKGNMRFRRGSAANKDEIFFIRQRATTHTTYETNTTPLTLNSWQWIGLTFDRDATGQQVRIYHAALGSLLAEQTYGTSDDGTGALVTEATDDLTVGNFTGGSSAWQGRAAVFIMFNKVLSTAAMHAQQYHLWAPVTTGAVVFKPDYGLVDGTGTQQDRSGAGNDGTVTGASIATHAPVQLIRPASKFELIVSSDKIAQLSWFELEVPDQPRRAQLSWFELETPVANRRAQLSWAELEVPVLNARAQVSWFELETPNADRRSQLSWFELETPVLNARAQVSWFELEVPSADRRGLVSQYELEVPSIDTRVQVSFFEFGVGVITATSRRYPRYVNRYRRQLKWVK